MRGRAGEEGWRSALGRADLCHHSVFQAERIIVRCVGKSLIMSRLAAERRVEDEIVVLCTAGQRVDAGAADLSVSIPSPSFPLSEIVIADTANERIVAGSRRSAC